jgi:uncharacterized repeat protein (TIGR01451 family)/CSLREA domain-containing protein
MSRHAPRRLSVLVPIALTALAACQDSTAPRSALRPSVHFAQGDNGIWTVTNLSDPGDGTCTDADCTLREAIFAAGLNGKIVFASTLQGDVDLTAGELGTGGQNLTIDGGGKIAIDGQGNSGVFALFGGAINPGEVKLVGLTIKGGHASVGAGIRVTAAKVTLENVSVLNNHADQNGGGIAVLELIGIKSNLTVRNSVIANNAADKWGGGLYVGGTNSATLDNSTVRDNTSTSSGAGIFNGGTVTVTGSTIADNKTDDFGGGIENANGATATLVRTTVSGNISTGAGAGAGAGVDNIGTASLRSSTVTKNTGGALYNAGTLTVSNSIVAGNSAGGVGGDVNCSAAPPISFVGYNVAGTDCPFGGQPGEVRVTPLQVFTEVLEAELKNNGGPTFTHALITRGRAVDRGYCPGESVDQRGFVRPVDDPTLPNALDGCDVGAYELQGPVAVVADLMISQSVDKSSVKPGDQVTYTVRVQNLGPQTAPNVVVNDVLSTGATFVEARATKGSFKAPPQGETGTVTWTLGDLLNGANEFAEIKVTVIIRGKTTITNSATVSGDVADPNTANNSAAITVSVGAGGKPSR